MFRLKDQRTGLEYIRTIMYYMSDATERVKREDIEQALLRQGAEGERVMATIAQEYIQEGFEQGLEQGIEQGRIQNLQDNILDLLDIRLGLVSQEVEEKVTAVTDTTILRQLLREAATAATIEAFITKLTLLTNSQ
jgi:flagellar biosynthesis/type III secretory pathway protein FliH